MKHTYM